MLAATLLKPGQIELQQVPVPTAGPEQLLVRVEAALTCGTDLKAYRRGHPFIPMPGPFGHQYAGVVEAVGAGVRGFEPGQPIWGVHSAPCGQCSRCQRQRYSLCERLTEQMVIGAFAQYMRIPERVVRQNVLPRPEHIAAPKAAFLEPVSCVVHALELMDFRGVDRVLVLGVGSMGLLFLQLLPQYTRASLVAAGRHAGRLALARELGITPVLDVGHASLDDYNDGRGSFDCVIECTGKEAGWQMAIDAVAPGGQVMLFGGLPKGSKFPLDTWTIHYEEVRLQGSFHFGPPDVRKAAELIADQNLSLDPMISGRMPLERLSEAFDAMAAGQGIKYVIDPWA